MSVSSNVTSNLPVQLTSFVERELAELGELLDSARDPSGNPGGSARL